MSIIYAYVSLSILISEDTIASNILISYEPIYWFWVTRHPRKPVDDDGICISEEEG